jgi:hypothetical protein
MRCGFVKHSSVARVPKLTAHTIEEYYKSASHLLFLLPNSSFGENDFYIHIITRSSCHFDRHIVMTHRRFHMVTPSTVTSRGEFYCPTHRLGSVQDSTDQSSATYLPLHLLFILPK